MSYYCPSCRRVEVRAMWTLVKRKIAIISKGKVRGHIRTYRHRCGEQIAMVLKGDVLADEPKRARHNIGV